MDDLVKRLRICAPYDPDQAEAADRIEALEKALRIIGYGPPDEGAATDLLNYFVDVARAALGEKG